MASLALPSAVSGFAGRAQSHCVQLFASFGSQVPQSGQGNMFGSAYSTGVCGASVYSTGAPSLSKSLA